MKKNKIHTYLHLFKSQKVLKVVVDFDHETPLIVSASLVATEDREEYLKYRKDFLLSHIVKEASNTSNP